MLNLLLHRFLNASSLEISLLLTVRPVVSIFSFYWGSFIDGRGELLRRNLMWAHFLSLIFFLFVPFIQTTSYLIFSVALYTLFYRAQIPALMEILKRNLPNEKREQWYSFATFIAYGEGFILSFFLGMIIDQYEGIWLYLFPLFALISMGSLWLQKNLPIASCIEDFQPIGKKRIDVLTPIKKGWALLMRRPDFCRFQIGYMLCGGGIMLALPAIPSFVFDYNISFLALFTSVNGFKELGFIVATPLFAKLMRRFGFEELSSWVFLGVSFFLITLSMMSSNWAYIFLAYFIYGFSQAGSHLLWNLSGPYYSASEESLSYSAVNVFTIGIRGAILPPIGGLLTDLIGPQYVLLLGAILSILGGLYLHLNKAKKPQDSPNLTK